MIEAGTGEIATRVVSIESTTQNYPNSSIGVAGRFYR